MKKILNSKVLILVLLLSVYLPSSSFAKDEYGVEIDDDSNVCQLTLNENTIHYHKDCNSSANFSYDPGTGTWNAGDSSEVVFEIDGIHGETAGCAQKFKALGIALDATGANWNGVHEDEYAGVITFSGAIQGCTADGITPTYEWYQVCGIKDDVLDQADCYIGYTADVTGYPPLNLSGDNNTSKFYACIGSNCGEGAQFSTEMEVLNSVTAVLHVAEIVLSILIF